MYGVVHGIGGALSAVSNKHVVLGLLIERPAYAYAVQQRFSTRFRFLSLSERVTYKLIDQLVDEGWIERAGTKQAGRTERGAPRVIYAATALGREEFSRWIAEPCEIGVAREEVHVKVVLSRPPDWPRVIELTKRLERTCLAAIRDMRAVGTVDQLSDPDIPWDTVAAVLVDDAEIIRLQGIVDWLRRVRAVVQGRMNPVPSGRRA